MSKNIVNHGPELMNGQSEAINSDQVIVLLSKILAMLNFAVNCNYSPLTEENLQSYFWVLTDLVEQLDVLVE
jgi:hypothetical protein